MSKKLCAMLRYSCVRVTGIIKYVTLFTALLLSLLFFPLPSIKIKQRAERERTVQRETFCDYSGKH